MKRKYSVETVRESKMQRTTKKRLPKRPLLAVSTSPKVDVW